MLSLVTLWGHWGQTYSLSDLTMKAKSHSFHMKCWLLIYLSWNCSLNSKLFVSGYIRSPPCISNKPKYRASIRVKCFFLTYIGVKLSHYISWLYKKIMLMLDIINKLSFYMQWKVQFDSFWIILWHRKVVRSCTNDKSALDIFSDSSFLHFWT